MNQELREMIQLRHELVQRYNSLDEAKEAYQFITMGPPILNIPKNVTSSNYDKSFPVVIQNSDKTIEDGVYYIFSDGSHALTSKHYPSENDSIQAIGVKLGSRRVAILINDLGSEHNGYHHIFNGNQCDKIVCEDYSKPYQAMSDMNGKQNTDLLIGCGVIQQKIIDSMPPNAYIPSCGELHLILLFLDEVKSALTQIGGQTFIGSYWSSTESYPHGLWYVGFKRGDVSCGNLLYGRRIRPAITWNL